MIRETHSVAETERVAEELAQSLRGGECIGVAGELGAGKTQFVRGLVRGIGGNPRSVSSPTFVLLNVYGGGRLTVFHLDAYRLGDADDVQAIGLAELLEQGGVVVVEWPERILPHLPQDRVNIRLTATGVGSRRIEIDGVGADASSGADHRTRQSGDQCIPPRDQV